MYVAVKGGERAIDASLALLEAWRRGGEDQPELQPDQIQQQLGLAVDRVMAEGSVLDPRLAALAIQQAQGDLVEAIFLLRACRATLARFGQTCPLETDQMLALRRISACFKDIPGGQRLGPTADYSLRILGLVGRSATTTSSTTAGPSAPVSAASAPTSSPRISSLLEAEGLLAQPTEPQPSKTPDITQDPVNFPMPRAARLQMLARADEGYLLALGYSTQRGYGSTHPFVGEIRMGYTPVSVRLSDIDPSIEDDTPIEIGELLLTECEMINQFQAQGEESPKFTRGYGLSPGRAERKAMAMALVDRALQAESLGETPSAPSQDQEFVLAHGDNVEASGFVQHLKLPHYVDFQAELALVRGIQTP
ncbi:MAG: hypothetical protein RLY30_1617 [Pseudomonadota bacterium]|jgi:alpha-D-ribose 1-methylphosphonate 5-triphosphate synthase subunit PhnI